MCAVGSAWNSISRSAASGYDGLNLATISSVTAIAAAGAQQLSAAGWVSGVTAPATRSSAGYTCPCHWYIADDASRHLRHFVIQGTDCIDSWKTNLQFEPVPFEDLGADAKVHRGVYESAQALYELFEPLVSEHLTSHPHAQLSFTGHSLGGSLATVLALMFKHRGVITDARQIAGVYTFGTAAVFCESCPTIPVSAPAAVQVQASSDWLDDKLLAKLGLPTGLIANVVATRDIVPRAFACDYSAAASLLMKVSPTYAQHHGLLASNRKILYHMIGEQLLLQPSPTFKWVHTHEAQHPLLPPGAGLWRVAQPSALSRALVKLHTRLAARAHAAGDTATAAFAADIPEASSPSDALLHFMDKPHPLTTLGEASAYGHLGSVSRVRSLSLYQVS